MEYSHRRGCALQPKDGSYYTNGNAYVQKNDGDLSRTAINSPVVLGYENWHGNKAEWMDNVGFCTNAVDYKWDIGLPDGTKRKNEWRWNEVPAPF